MLGELGAVLIMIHQAKPVAGREKLNTAHAEHQCVLETERGLEHVVGVDQHFLAAPAGTRTDIVFSATVRTFFEHEAVLAARIFGLNPRVTSPSEVLHDVSRVVLDAPELIVKSTDGTSDGDDLTLGRRFGCTYLGRKKLVAVACIVDHHAIRLSWMQS